MQVIKLILCKMVTNCVVLESCKGSLNPLTTIRTILDHQIGIL